MFEIGRAYRITTIVSAEGTGVYTVAAVERTLIRLTNPYGPDRVVNTASWHFVQAELVA